MNGFRTWIWRQIRFALPADWMMLQFSKHSPQGRCAFADRYQYRFEIDWRQVPSVPDFERMLSDLQAKLAGDHENYEAQRVNVAEWHGIWGNESGQVISRFGRYFEPIGCLVEAIFIWPDGRDEECEIEILGGAGCEPPRDSHTRWSAFGMQMQVPSALYLAECRVEPAAVELEFEGNGKRRVSFARRGMVRQWLHGSVEAWLRKQVGREVRDPEVTTRSRAGHDVVHLVGHTMRPGIGGRFAPRMVLTAEAWICPESGRLMSVVSRAADNEQMPKLRCCRLMEGTDE